MHPIDEIVRLFAARGADAYFGECVSTTEHSLQAAYLACSAAAPATLVLAALLHDIGHLVGAATDDLAGWTDDARHEDVGAAWLARYFPAEVSEPVRLHVPAKRYLCATDGAYVARLSPASVLTLELQGGAMNRAEIARFEAEPFCVPAIELRRWDDGGKVAGVVTPALEDYRSMLDQWLRATPGSQPVTDFAAATPPAPATRATPPQRGNFPAGRRE